MEVLPTDTGEVETGQESISLPAEIWEMILDRVERNIDLLACRMVNRLWYSITTPICRRHFVRLNLCQVLQHHGNMWTSFYSTFQDCTNLPWSACKLQLDDLPQTRGRNSLLRQFISLFGSHIHEFTISGGGINNNEGILWTLGGVPNIKYLDISWMKIQEQIQEPFTTQLGKLKGLISYLNSHQDFRFLELLLSRPEVQLSSLQLSISHWIPMGYAKIVSTLITGIPILHLDVELEEFVPELFTHLTRKRVQVQQLKIQLNTSFVIPQPQGRQFVFHRGFRLGNLNLPPFPISYSYSPLEEFLKNTADSLQQLTLIDNQSNHQRENSLLTIPTLPQLTCLGVVGLTWEHSVLSNVTPFTSDQFPKLAKVNVRVWARSDRVTLFDLGPFDTVTKLGLEVMDTLSADRWETDWDLIFPNLKELDAKIAGRELPLIFTKFQRLERLFLTVWLYPPQQLGGLSTILNGGRQFRSAAEGQNCFSQGESGTASLLSLTCLRQFKLHAYPEQQTISDAFVDSYLLQIQPLYNLYLENVFISEESKEKLQKYHWKVEIYDKSSKRNDYNTSSKFHGVR